MEDNNVKPVNVFLQRPGESNEQRSRDIVVRALREEFPDDPLLKEGILSIDQRPDPKPVTAIAERNSLTNLLEIDADVSASYGEYTLSKLLPSVEDDALDDLLNDEFGYFVSDEPNNPIPLPPITGLFLVTPIRPDDWHDWYIQKGPENIPLLLAEGIEEDEIIRSIFCVWYIERGKGRPIPNWKTLEVMLVERNLTYSDIGTAEITDITEYDLRLDGRYTEYASTDENGESLEPPSLLDEFVDRAMINRSHLWTYKTRFRSGYTPGKTYTGESFLRDPADYQRPESSRVPGYEEQYVDPDTKLIKTRTVVPREARIRQENPEFDPLVNIPAWIDADPNDYYFDEVFYQTQTEKWREIYEGRLVIPIWSKATNQQSFDALVSQGTDNLRVDDLFFDLSFMIFGCLKQVTDLDVLRRIATNQGYNYDDYDSSLEILNADVLEPDQYDALSNINGLINTIFKQGGIDSLGSKTNEVWLKFPKIKEVDRLDMTEYETYVTEYASEGIFSLEELAPYEPPGSIVYYQARPQMKRYLSNLQEQAILQAAVTEAKDQCLELFIPLAARASEFRRTFNRISAGGYFNKLRNTFGPQSDVQNLIIDASVSDSNWILNKKTGKDVVKEKGKERGLMRLVEREGQIIRDSLRSTSAENDIFRGVGGTGVWHINAHAAEKNGRRLIDNYGPSSGFPLIDSNGVSALEYATGRNFGVRVVDVSGDAKFIRPQTESGDRNNKVMESVHYFRATVANFIMKRVLESTDGLPKDALADIYKPSSDLIAMCKTADEFLEHMRDELIVIEQAIATFDKDIIAADTVEEVLAIKNTFDTAQLLFTEFEDELFDWYDKLDRHIDRERDVLMRRIVAGIQFIRSRVYDRNDKYWIQVPTSIQNRVIRYGLSLGGNKPEGF